MAVYLDESMVGEDYEINYPNLLLCIGVTCQMSDGWLIGCHIDAGDSEEDQLAELKRRINAREKKGELAMFLFLIGNLELNLKHGGRSWIQKAQALSFKGRLWVYDSKSQQSTDGFFARLRSNRGAQPFQRSRIWVCPDPVVRPYSNYAGGDDVTNVNLGKRTAVSFSDYAYQFPKGKTTVRNGITNQPQNELAHGDFQFISI